MLRTTVERVNQNLCNRLNGYDHMHFYDENGLNLTRVR